MLPKYKVFAAKHDINENFLPRNILGIMYLYSSTKTLNNKITIVASKYTA